MDKILAPEMSMPSVLISVLNWNTASVTLECISSLLRLENKDLKVEILVIDNGSEAADFARLKNGLAGTNVTLHSEPINRGFAGGHNIAIARAVEENHAFVWLVNSDVVIDDQSVLVKLIEAITSHPKCAAVSPLIASIYDAEKIHFAGNFHDWERRITRRPNIAKARELQETDSSNSWVSGAAVLFRSSALKEVGGLDERFFAYYEDDEIGARLSSKGWTSRVVFDVRVRHVEFKVETDRPPYYFYLMQRNFLIFWFENTPGPYRSLLWLKLIDQAFFDANKLYFKGLQEKGDASLLGIRDFLFKQYGAPNLKRSISPVFRLLQKISMLLQHRIIKKTVTLRS